MLPGPTPLLGVRNGSCSRNGSCRPLDGMPWFVQKQLWYGMPLNEPFKIDQTKMGMEIATRYLEQTLAVQWSFNQATQFHHTAAFRERLVEVGGYLPMKLIIYHYHHWTSLLGFFNLNLCPKRSMTLVIRWSSCSFPIAQEQGNWKWPLEYPQGIITFHVSFLGCNSIAPYSLWFNI